MRRVIPFALVVAALAASCFSFDRLLGVEPGSVVGRTVNNLAAVVSFSRIGVEGTTTIHRAGDDGEFAVSGLTEGAWVLRLASDENGDGVPEQAALKALILAQTVAADGTSALGRILLGDVPLDGTAVLVGRVLDESGLPAAGCKVAVWRGIEDLDPEQKFVVEGRTLPPADLGVEATTGTDADGRFRVAGIIHGTAQVSAFCGPGRASVPARERVVAGPDVDYGDLNIVPGGTRPAQIISTPAPSSGDLLRVDFVAPSGSRAVTGDVEASVEVPAGAQVALDAPTGLWDVHVTVLRDGDEVAHGFLPSRAVPPGAADDVILWGSVLLESLDPCAVDREDLDRDSVLGLPPAPDPSWAACVPACIESFGSTAAATCRFEGETYDCDDDDDGQPDITEPACLGVCRGTDLDADDVCDPVDPFPGCASNDPNDPACDATDHPWTPPPPALNELPVGSYIPIDLQPATAWTQGIGDQDGPCGPIANPQEQSFVETIDDGVIFSAMGVAIADNCCSCVERTRSFPLSFPVDTANLEAALTGVFDATRTDEALNVGSVRIELLNATGVVASRTFAAENRPNNECAADRPEALLQDGEPFFIPLSDIAPEGGVVDGVRIRLQGFACAEGATNSVELRDVALFVPTPELPDAGTFDGGTIDACFGIVAPVCGAAIDAQVTCQEHLAALQGCTAVGDLVVSGNDVTDLSPLSSLTTVNGDLVLLYNPLTDLSGLDALTSVSGSVTVSSMPNLASLHGLEQVTSYQSLNLSTLPALTSFDGLAGIAANAAGTTWLLTDLPIGADTSALAAVTSLYQLQASGTVDLGGLDALQTIDSYLSLYSLQAAAPTLPALETVPTILITANPNLTSLSGLGALTSTTSLTISSNPVLTTLNGFSSLQSIDGSLSLTQNDALTSLGNWPALTRLDELYVQDNAALTNAGSFPVLSTLGSLGFSSNATLGRLPTFPATLTAFSSIYIDACPMLQLFGIESFADGGAITVINSGITSLGPLAGLRTIGGELMLLNNAGLANVDGLSGLTRVSGTLSIEGSPAALTSLPSFGALTTLGGLTLRENPGLANIGGFGALQTLSYLEITGTPASAGLLGTAAGPIAPYTVVLRDTDIVDLTLLAHMSSIGQLTIDQNPLLSSMTGTTGLTSVNSLTITANPSLDQCEINAWVAYLQSAPTTTFSGNDTSQCP